MKTIYTYITKLFLLVTLASNDASAQLTVKREISDNECDKIVFYNTSKDTLYILSYENLQRFEGDCISNFTSVDTFHKQITIETDFIYENYLEYETPHWIFIFPDESYMFNIKKVRIDGFQTKVEASVRAKHLNNTKRSNRISKRAVFKTPKRHLTFDL